MLGNLLRRLLRREADRPSGARIARVPGGSENVWLEKALRLQGGNRHRELVVLCESVLQREPANVEALQLLAVGLCGLGRSREGIAHLRRVTELNPDVAEAHANLATVLAAAGEAESALAGFGKAVSLRPRFSEAWNSLAGLLKTLGRYDEAEQACRSGLIAAAQHAGLNHVLAGALFEQGRVEEAITAVRAALATAPELAVAHSDLVRMLNYVDATVPAAIFAEHRAWGERHADALTAAALPHSNNRDPARRMRVGFVSPYFCKHAMTFFFESVLAHHDHASLEIFLYADVRQPDEYSERLKGYGAKWRQTVELTDEQLAQAVREDAIDILVDLSGHTPYNRLLAFARRPAPIQVTWNGYPNTTGMRAMDYRITDALSDPPGMTEALHSETLVRLPDIYMTWQPPVDAPEVGPLPAFESGHVTFGSFNSCFKITPSLAALWARVLRAVPRSRLMLLTVTSRGAEQRIRDLFAGHGIGPEQMEILPRMTHEEFLSVHRRADLALDSFPYHGTTTTCFSLWMGLPVVALAGPTHVSRVGVSLLSNLGTPEWIARSSDEYVEIAVRLSSDLPALAASRAALRQKMRDSPITDGARGARALEDALRRMWSDWCSVR